jgi:molybdenum-dependent DNA-binding transcriptional regulator ModE
MSSPAFTRVRQCPECRKWHSRPRSQFCSTHHQGAWNNRQKAEGAAIVAMVKAAMAGRGGGHTPGHPIGRVAMREMTQIARQLNDADREAGRMSALDYAAILMADGSRHFDRRRT